MVQMLSESQGTSYTLEALLPLAGRELSLCPFRDSFPAPFPRVLGSFALSDSIGEVAIRNRSIRVIDREVTGRLRWTSRTITGDLDLYTKVPPTPPKKAASA